MVPNIRIFEYSNIFVLHWFHGVFTTKILWTVKVIWEYSLKLTYCNSRWGKLMECIWFWWGCQQKQGSWLTSQIFSLHWHQYWWPHCWLWGRGSHLQPSQILENIRDILSAWNSLWSAMFCTGSSYIFLLLCFGFIKLMNSSHGIYVIFVSSIFHRIHNQSINGQILPLFTSITEKTSMNLHNLLQY